MSALLGSRRRWVGAAIAVAAVAALLWMWPRGTETAELERNVIAVLPFRVTAPDSSYNYLREGAVDLLSAGLTGDGIPRSIDTRAVLSAYRVRTKAQGGDLPSAQAASLARRLGAMYALTGEVVATSGQITVSTRLLSASSGRAVADHIETGTGSALGLVSRAGMRLLAKSLGEAATRVRYLSDSLDAVRAYLAGMQSYRSGQTRAAFDQLGQALQIDSTFAPAALWRAYVAWGASTFGSPEKRGADSVAWSLRFSPVSDA
jgi:TolB-like protein